MKKFMRRKSPNRSDTHAENNDELELPPAQNYPMPIMPTDTTNNPIESRNHPQSSGATIWETRIRRFEQLQDENEKLKDVTERVFQENMDLKEKLNKLIRETSAEKQQPNWRESKKLIQLVTQENDYLLNHIRKEHDHLRDMKTAHLNEVQKLSEQLDNTTLEKTLIEKSFQKLKLSYDEVKARADLLSEEFQHSIPLNDHREALSECQQALKDLKRVYQQEMSAFQQDLELAALKREEASQGRWAEMEAAQSDLRRTNTVLEAQLGATAEAKEEAEFTLARLLNVVEGHAREKEDYLKEKQRLQDQVRKLKRA